MTESSSKWKDPLLRSSLPLEYLIAKKLNDIGVYVSGEYSYLRPNENGLMTEFSTDIWAFKFLEENEQEDLWACINFIMECKYTYKSTKWIFAPYPSDENISSGYINIFQDFAVQRIDKNLLHNFEQQQNLKYCFKGIELLEKDCNPNTISKGLNQLKYASIQLAKTSITNQICAWHDDELKIEFLCPILLTTAPLYILKNNLSLENIEQAVNVEDIADKVDALIVSQNKNVQLHDYINQSVIEFRKSYNSEINTTLQKLDEILMAANYNDYYMSDDFFLDGIIGNPSERILVLNYNSFEENIQKIINLISATKSTLTRYATLEHDQENHTRVIKPLN